MRAGDFDADVEIRKGHSFFGHGGSATVRDGWLTLRNRREQVLAQAPVREVSAGKTHRGVRIWIGGESYSVEPLWEMPYQAPSFAREAAEAGGRARQGGRARRLSRDFLNAVVAQGGHVGRP
jgi:hypothetical protein